jgi:hypothetical protein
VDETPKKRRGRPPGSTGPTGPRVGSRPWQITRMQPGERLFLEAPVGRLQRFMQQIAVDISRCKLNRLVTQTHMLGVIPSTREVVDMVILTRLPNPED